MEEPKPKEISVFFLGIKDHCNVSKAFSKSGKSKSLGIFLTAVQLSIKRISSQKTSLVIVYQFVELGLQAVCNSYCGYLVVAI